MQYALIHFGIPNGNFSYKNNSHLRLSFIWLILDIRLIILILITTFHLQFSWSCAIDVLKSQFQKVIPLILLT